MAVTTPSTRAKARNYPPLMVAGLAVLALLAILPSSLNLPQSSPTETLEYAPVPPSDDNIAPPVGNFSSLGLGSSASIGSTATPGDDDLDIGQSPGGQAIKTAATKRCVGNPPRQTEDPLSPPCVASFTGDNGGATYPGVTRNEIQVVFPELGGVDRFGGSRNAHETAPTNRYYDLAEPPPEDEGSEPLSVRSLRVWQRYFNERYQTYGRFVHFHVHYGPGAGTAEESRAQAAENYQRLKPFAVSTFSDDYQKVMASKGVVAFSDLAFVSEDTFNQFSGLYWNYSPSLEMRARSFVSHACTKVVGQPVSDSGNPGENGQPRKYGLIYNDSAVAESVKFRTMVRSGMEACGAKIDAVGTYDCDCLTEGDSTYAAPIMADFKSKAISTVIWVAGGNPSISKAAKTNAYFPEWVIAGDGLAEGTVNGQSEDQDVWDHAWVVTPLPLVETSGVTKACEQAYAEAGGFDHPVERSNTCLFFYDGLRQMFTGIQVAGPKLNIENLDKGYHAIPPKNSPRPDLPACFYDPGDYTCVKDATVMWWDSTAPGSLGKGCWRMAEGGARYRVGTWPPGNLDAQRQPDNVCNNYIGGGALTL